MTTIANQQFERLVLNLWRGHAMSVTGQMRGAPQAAHFPDAMFYQQSILGQKAWQAAARSLLEELKRVGETSGIGVAASVAVDELVDSLLHIPEPPKPA